MELSAYIYAFIIGGAICVIGQLLISLTRLTSARVLVLFVVSGVVLTGLGLYEPLVRLAGAGATTPLTGFGYALGKGAIDGAMEDGLMGVHRRHKGHRRRCCRGNSFRRTQCGNIHAKDEKVGEINWLNLAIPLSSRLAPRHFPRTRGQLLVQIYTLIFGFPKAPPLAGELAIRRKAY